MERQEAMSQLKKISHCNPTFLQRETKYLVYIYIYPNSIKTGVSSTILVSIVIGSWHELRDTGGQPIGIWEKLKMRLRKHRIGKKVEKSRRRFCKVSANHLRSVRCFIRIIISWWIKKRIFCSILNCPWKSPPDCSWRTCDVTTCSVASTREGFACAKVATKSKWNRRMCRDAMTNFWCMFASLR